MSDTTATAATKPTYEETAQLAMNEAELRVELKRVMRERTMLAQAIFDCGTKTGLLRKDLEGMTGPELLSTANDIAEMYLSAAAQLEQVSAGLGTGSQEKIYQVFLNFDGDPEDVNEDDDTLEIAWVQGDFHSIQNLVEGTGASVLEGEMEMPEKDVQYRVPGNAEALLARIAEVSRKPVLAPAPRI
jgi:hypothetical protein